jgi:hypothetical protein
MVIVYCLLHPGARVVCVREIQKTLAESAKALIEAKIQEFGVGHELRVLFDCIETAGDGLISFIGIQAWRLVGSILNGWRVPRADSTEVCERLGPTTVLRPARRRRHREPEGTVEGNRQRMG